MRKFNFAFIFLLFASIAFAQPAPVITASAPTGTAVLTAPSNSARRSLLIQNIGTVDCYLGSDNTVTTSTGILLKAGASYSIASIQGYECNPTAYYAITGGGTGSLRAIDGAGSADIKNQSSLIVANSWAMGSDSLTAGGTRYSLINSSAAGSTALDSLSVFPAPTNATISNLYVALNAAAGSGKTVTVTLYVNGSASTLTVPITGTSAKSGNDVSHSVTVTAGDILSVYQNETSGGSATKVNWSMKIAQ